MFLDDFLSLIISFKRKYFDSEIKVRHRSQVLGTVSLVAVVFFAAMRASSLRPECRVCVTDGVISVKQQESICS